MPRRPSRLALLLPPLALLLLLLLLLLAPATTDAARGRRGYDADVAADPRRGGGTQEEQRRGGGGGILQGLKNRFMGGGTQQAAGNSWRGNDNKNLDEEMRRRQRGGREPPSPPPTKSGDGNEEAISRSHVTYNDKGLKHEFSLRRPYDYVNPTTKEREIPGWRIGGNGAKIFNNFIRLTPDKPSKTGYVSSATTVGNEDWTAYLRFRISGKSESLSGDGIAFWYYIDKRFREGMLMGSSDSFTGIGVIFDTFMNDPSSHQDVTVVASDGDNVVTLSGREKFPGCNLKKGKFRHWEGSKGFDVEDESRVKITMVGTRVKVEVDAKYTDEWEACVDADMTPWLPRRMDRWRKDTRFAISAATGALSDNHDILELLITSPDEFDRIMKQEEALQNLPAVQVDIKTEVIKHENRTVEHKESADTVQTAAHLNDLAYEVKDIDDKLSKLHYQIEHQIEKVAHDLETLLHGLENQERMIEERVAELERRQTSNVFKALEGRVAELERKLMDTVARVSGDIERRVGDELQATKSTGGSWRLPFVAFFLACAGAFAWTIRKVRKLDARDKVF